MKYPGWRAILQITSHALLPQTKSIKWILALFGTFLLTPAHAAPPNCTNGGNYVGQGVKIKQICTAKASEFDTFDAYYRLVIYVTPAQGFQDRMNFKERSTQGKALEGLLSSLAGSKKALNVDIGISIVQGASQYPVRSILNFKKVNDNEWTSMVRGDSRSFFHRLNNGEPFTVTLKYSYSKTSSIDMSPATNLLQSAGVNLVTPAVLPLLTAANTVANSIIATGNVTSDSGYEFTFSPSLDRNVSSDFEIIDPKTNSVIATVKLRLEGSRSLFADPQEHGNMAATLPTGQIAVPTMNSLSRQIATGQAQSWDLLNSALASTSFDAVPLGKEPTPTDVQSFCAATESGLLASYSLASFDSLLVRARLLNLATRTVQSRFNPYTQCFTSDQRAIIQKYLAGIDPNYTITVAPTLVPLNDFEALYRLGCYLKGAAGDDCIDYSPTMDAVANTLDDTVIIAALEGVQAKEFFEGLDGNNLAISRADFLTRFSGKFSNFWGIEAKSGSLRLRETQGGTSLRLYVERSIGGKIQRITIRRST
jgi:hypothetical protein